ncbi:helix-turn-helix domain-containing protein [Streptosporangium sp. NPDC023615]|uniref:ArsR/SmtB family transcription factor n=1 Tax=Streptosporangium sp. NPDC023615 TaxID=3154794 RepID=UPI00341FCDE5
MPTAPVRVLEHPAPEEITLEGVLHALSDPTRLRIVRFLWRLEEDEGAPCSAIELEITKSTTTHHFRVLREAGVISQVYRGTAKMNALRRRDLGALFPGLLDAILAADAARHEREDVPARSPA